MKNNHLRKIIILGTLLLACLMIVQVYWFKRAFDVAERQFDHTVQIAMKKVADSVTRDSEIKKLSSSFFVANTKSELNDKVIDSLVKEEFSSRSLEADYELGVYNAHDDTLMYGHYVEATRKPFGEEWVEGTQSPVEKNFVVYFPNKKSYLAAGLDIWIFSTLVLVLMMGFFAYAIISLLKEKRFSELKNDFISNMTHEFKTPVTNIGIAGEIIKQKMAGQEGSQVYVDILLKENEKLRQKIEKVLLGASVEHLKPSFETMDIHQLIKDCAEAFQLKVNERSGNLLLEFNATHPFIPVDRELLMQAVTNVIDNAEKYSPNKPQIVVRTKDRPNGIEIIIMDNGMGIAPDMAKKVFEKFFRVPAGDVHNVKGFGLGLNFVKNVIRSHRGEVDLFSEANKGTQVKIFLPTS